VQRFEFQAPDPRNFSNDFSLTNRSNQLYWTLVQYLLKKAFPHAGHSDTAAFCRCTSWAIALAHPGKMRELLNDSRVAHLAELKKKFGDYHL
jgi:hypothetical protein